MIMPMCLFNGVEKFNFKPRSAGFFMLAERLLLADSRSLGSGFQRPLTRKLPLKPAKSAPIYDQQPTLGTEVSGVASRQAKTSSHGGNAPVLNAKYPWYTMPITPMS
jgi:hypothetical protein